MYQIRFDCPCRVHFIGIGGISMSGLAEILIGAGFSVSGSDASASALTERITKKGAHVFIGQRAENLRELPDLVVYTAAIRPDNPEFAAAKASGVPMLSRAELLGQIMKNYKTAIAVAGTHGKTTTTSMVSHILLKAALDPTISVGGMLPAIHGNIRVGTSSTFVTEACEYTNSFLSFFPTIGIVLNIDADHLDFFKDLDDIARSFRRFAELIPPEGCLITNADDPRSKELTESLPCRLRTYALTAEADYTAADIVYDEHGCGSFTCIEDGKVLGSFTLNVPGVHNVSNALSAIALGRLLGLDPETIAAGLAEFRGTERRFEYKGMLSGVTVIDDYAHHPTEIKATMNAAKTYPHREIWVVFQPHTYSRTKALLQDFADALSFADHVVLADIYAARETDDLGISSKDLRDSLTELGCDAYYFKSFDEIENFLKSHCIPGDLLITMGAGNIVEVGNHLLA